MKSEDILNTDESSLHCSQRTENCLTHTVDRGRDAGRTNHTFDALGETLLQTIQRSTRSSKIQLRKVVTRNVTRKLLAGVKQLVQPLDFRCGNLGKVSEITIKTLDKLTSSHFLFMRAQRSQTRRFFFILHSRPGTIDWRFAQRKQQGRERTGSGPKERAAMSGRR